MSFDTFWRTNAVSTGIEGGFQHCTNSTSGRSYGLLTSPITTLERGCQLWTVGCCAKALGPWGAPNDLSQMACSRQNVSGTPCTTFLQKHADRPHNENKSQDQAWSNVCIYLHTHRDFYRCNWLWSLQHIIGKTPAPQALLPNFWHPESLLQGNPFDGDDKTCHHHVKGNTIIWVQLLRQRVPLVCMICDSCGETLCNHVQSHKNVLLDKDY